MVRCVLAALLGGVMLAASAQVAPSRPFPATALRGQIEVVQPPDVVLNGQPARLAPGARIRGENNLLQMSGALVGQKLTVNYTRDPFGLVMDVWVLTPEERSREPWPRTAEEAQRWSFDPAARAWTRR
ncbi:MAG: hypothetical protein HY855_24435 [Burkholderiales bacterium]|nr:hypothetical protein [Burkholderiales bacterium]